jgi:hypothetical protein
LTLLVHLLPHLLLLLQAALLWKQAVSAPYYGLLLLGRMRCCLDACRLQQIKPQACCCAPKQLPQLIHCPCQLLQHLCPGCWSTAAQQLL